MKSRSSTAIYGEGLHGLQPREVVVGARQGHVGIHGRVPVAGEVLGAGEDAGVREARRESRRPLRDGAGFIPVAAHPDDGIRQPAKRSKGAEYRGWYPVRRWGG